MVVARFIPSTIITFYSLYLFQDLSQNRYLLLSQSARLSSLVRPRTLSDANQKIYSWLGHYA